MSQPEQIGLRYLSLAYRLRRIVDDRMTAAGLSLARTKVLQILARCGPLSQTALADELGHAPRSVTQAIEALERDKLVERTADPDDRRRNIVTLTAEGTAALASGATAGEQVLHQIFRTLDSAQLATLSDLLDTIETALDA